MIMKPTNLRHKIIVLEQHFKNMSQSTVRVSSTCIKGTQCRSHPVLPVLLLKTVIRPLQPVHTIHTYITGTLQKKFIWV